MPRRNRPTRRRRPPVLVVDPPQITPLAAAGVCPRCLRCSGPERAEHRQDDHREVWDVGDQQPPTVGREP